MDTKKKKRFKPGKPSLYFITIGSVVIILLIYAVLIQCIGYFAFTRSFSKEYSESVLRTARLCSQTFDGDDFSEYLNYDQETLDFIYSLGFYSDYEEYCEENGIEPDSTLYINASMYGTTKDTLNEVCNTMGMAVIYIIIPDDDYMNYTCVYNCVSDSSGYDPWELGHRVETPSSYYDAYKRIYEGGSSEEVVTRFTNLNGGKPHITALIPLHDPDGNVCAILCTQRFADGLTKARKNFLQGVGALTVILAIIIILLEARLLRVSVIGPIASIANEADRFAKDSTQAGTLLSESDFKVKEIHNLALSLDKMEVDTVENIENIKTMAAEKERVGADLSLASKIQMGMLPLKHQLLTEHSEFDIHAVMNPAKEVGGDFYDFYMIDDTHLAIEIADVSDKGMGAAFFMAISKTLIKSRAGLGGSASEILAYVDKMIAEKNMAGMFVTVWLGIIDLTTGHVDVCNAGHDYPAVSLKGQDYVIEKTPHGPPISFIPGVPFTGYEFDLEPGDRIFLYTDGVNEAKRSDGERFGIERMLTVLNEHKNDDNEQLIAAMKESVAMFVGKEPQFDDMTMLSFTFNKIIEKND